MWQVWAGSEVSRAQRHPGGWARAQVPLLARPHHNNRHRHPTISGGHYRQTSGPAAARGRTSVGTAAWRAAGMWRTAGAPRPLRRAPSRLLLLLLLKKYCKTGCKPCTCKDKAEPRSGPLARRLAPAAAAAARCATHGSDAAALLSYGARLKRCGAQSGGGGVQQAALHFMQARRELPTIICGCHRLKARLLGRLGRS